VSRTGVRYLDDKWRSNVFESEFISFILLLRWRMVSPTAQQYLRIAWIFQYEKSKPLL
jgi:hypothetical protein